MLSKEEENSDVAKNFDIKGFKIYFIKHFNFMKYLNV